MPTPDWSTWREEFPGLQKSTYLNTVSLGQLSQRSRRAVNHFMDEWSTYGAAAWYRFWLEEVDALRGEFARTIGAKKEEIAILPNISSALAAVSSCFEFTDRSRVVSCELDFPTITHHFLAKESQGVESSILPSPDRISVPVESFAASINERTALIATCRVYFTSGFIQDVQQLADIAHQKGALCLIDDYQGTGQIPIDVNQAGVDFLISGGLKWLIGGPGVAYLYVRGELIADLKPTVSGWFAHNRQFDFDPFKLEYREDARRFEAGTPAVPAVYAARAGLEIINEIGTHEIRRRSAELSQDLIARLKAHGYSLRIPANPKQQASIIIVELDNPLEVTHSLAEQNIIVDKRPGTVRISPYFYNTVEENEIFVNGLDEVCRR